VLNDDTWQKLQSVKEDAAFQGQRWPVMMLKTQQSSLPAEPAEEIKSGRKYLSVD